jgi:ATP-dependent RNA helicase DDX21
VLVATDVAARGLDIPNVDLIIQLQPPFEVESYIHRSGRTARAGKEGKCITLYSRDERKYLNEIRRQAGVNFKEETLPSQAEIVEKSSANVHKNLEEIDEDVLELFRESAIKLILDKGALNAVSTALAYISGVTKASNKCSLLSGRQGFVTFKLSFEDEVNESSHDILQRIIPRNANIRYENLNNSPDGKTIIFDISADNTKRFQGLYEQDVKQSQNDYYKIEEVKAKGKV